MLALETTTDGRRGSDPQKALSRGRASGCGSCFVTLLGRWQQARAGDAQKSREIGFDAIALFALFPPRLVAAARDLRTLLDAGRYVEALPKAKHDRPEWQTAIRFLLMAAEGRLPVMFAHVAMLKALNAGKPKPASAPRKKATKKYRLVR